MSEGIDSNRPHRASFDRHPLLRARKDLAKKDKVIEGLEEDSLTGFLRHDYLKEKVVDKLEKGEKGVLVVADLVGLKSLNSWGHEAGDNGLKIVAKLLRAIFPNAMFGRKGDEFYVWVSSTHVEKEVKEAMSMYLQSLDPLSRREPKSGSTVRFYWQAEAVNSKDSFYDVLHRLDERVEEVKAKVGDMMLDSIDKFNGEKLLWMIVLYANLKERTKPRALYSLIKSSVGGENFLTKLGLTSFSSKKDMDMIIERVPDDIKIEFFDLQRHALKSLGQGDMRE